MKKQEVALITYHDNGQISEVKIRNQETNLIKKSSVYNRNGILTGKHHFETPDRMQELLDDEGVKVINDEIVDFDKCFWNPTIELELP